MDIRIKGSAVSGAFDAVASKSDVHRALICAALSDKPSKIKFESVSEDIEATVRCLNALGAEITLDKSGAEINPIKEVNQGALLDCGESGSTIRFMIPVSAALGAQSRFTGRGRLAERPLEPLATVMKSNGCSFSRLGVFPLEVGGTLRAGDYEIPGNVSSQFITGLLLALPVAGGGSVKVIPPVESQKYIDMTVKTMIKYGAHIKRDGFDFYVDKSGYSPKQDEYISDGDWSNSAFFLCAAAISGKVRCNGVFGDSLQGDKEIVNILERFGAKVMRGESFVEVSSAPLSDIDIDASQIPDLVPVLAVTAAFAEGKTKIYNASRLRLKESDRLSAVAQMLTSIGAQVEEREDSLIITGNPGAVYSGTVDSFNDHRMVMSAAVAALGSGGEITVRNAQAVNKSYPSFFETLSSLGGIYDVVQLRQ